MELTREQQIAIIEGAPERMDAYARKLLADPMLLAELRRCSAVEQLRLTPRKRNRYQIHKMGFRDGAT